MTFYNFKIALLNLKSKSLITIGSLLTLIFGGICIVLLLSYVDNELSMNKFHKRETDIYIAVCKVTPQSDWRPIDLSHFFNLDYTAHPEVEKVAKVAQFKEGDFLINANQKTLEPSGIFTDSTFFDILDFNLIIGDKKAFSNPDAIFLTEDLARKFYGDTNPIGETVAISGRNSQTMTIAGILENPKSNSSLKFNFIVPYKEKYSKTGVDFILFKKGVDKKPFIEKIKNAGKNHHQFSESEMSVIPFRDIYFQHSNSRFEHHFSKSGNMKNIYILLACILLLFIISCLNFSNLQLLGVNSSLKKNEIFKANGANQLHLSVYLILENIIISILSIGLILLGVFMFLPHFNQVIETNLELSEDYILLLSTLYVTSQLIIALIFPLSIIRRNHFKKNKMKIIGQKQLVIFQFILLVSFLISSIVSTKQINLLLNKNLGFNYSNIIKTRMFYEIPFIENREEYFKKSDERKDNLKYVKDQLQSSPLITSFTQGNSPINPYAAPWKIQEEGSDYTSQAMLIVNPIHANVFEFKVVQGRFFDEELDKSREDKMVINEAALKFWNVKDIENTILKNRYWQKGDYEIIGVIKDYHFEHLSAKPNPLVMLYFYDIESDFFIRLNDKNIRAGIQYVEKLFKQFNPQKTFEYSFVSDQIQKMYAGEKRLRLVYIIFTIISILIACLGLFTIALFDTKKKTKEIGVRKVNGAKNYEIMRLLNKDFLKLVFTALIIAIPISYFAMNQWLQNFAYKTELSWWIFALAGIIAMGIAMLTVSWQSWRAARRNPVESLRYE